MPRLPSRVLLAASISLALAPLAHAQVKTEIGFLWHMHQPNYYPGENIVQTQNNGRYSFNVVDVHNSRFGPYTHWPKDAMYAGQNLPNLGASVSFSGTLMQNLNVLRDNNVNGGMWNNWTTPYNEGRNLKTARNNSRLDLIGFGYSHALLPLMDDRDIRMQVKLHKQMTQNTFGSAIPYSKGFFPAETAFSERIIPALVAEGIEWTIYDNIHVDRATKNYPHTNSSNLYAPNRADQVNPDPVASGGAWVQLNNLWAPSKVSAPNSYRPAWVQHVNPNTGQISKIIGVPAARYEGNEDGRGGFGALQYQSVMDQYRQYNTDPARPQLVVLHHDGDNYGGGSDAYYHGNWNSMVNWANNNANYNVTGIQDYLDRFPVPQSAVVKVADGSWAGADNGDPEFKKWLADPNGAGWSPDRNSWAVLTAAKNRVYTAEDVQPVTNLNNIINNTGNHTERAWGALIQAQASDYWYWDGTEIWDSNATRGANLAVQHANNVLTPSVLANEATPPTVFVPQRDTYNPGEVEWGPNKESSDFNIWTYAYDVSGLQSVTLKFRTDKDGENPLTSTQNEVYAVGAEVDAWQSLAMTSSDVAPQNGVLTPLYRALKFAAPISGITNKLLDYYVEAIDARGNITRTDIQHVWVGAGNVVTPTNGFTMDGVLDLGTTVLATNGSLSINYKVEDGKLYIAAPDAGEGNDHFIFLAQTPGALRAAQWAKAGQVADWSAFLADENGNDYEGWFDTTATNGAATGANGGVLEGFIDLAGEFGGVYPEEIYVAFGAWTNPDGGTLVASAQVPAGNGNGNLEAAEYVKLVMPQPEWAGSVTGDWSTKVGWTLTMSPNQPTMTAKFGTRGTGSATVTLDQAVTINRLELGGTSYSIQPGLTPFALTFAGTNAKSIDVVAGNHTIGVPVVMNKDSQVSVVTGATVRLTSTLTATGRSITKTGGGVFEMNTLRAAGLNVDAGTAKLSLSLNGVSRLGSLNVATGATFDLGGGSMLIDGAGQFNAVSGLVTGGKIVTSIPSSGADVGYARLSDLYTTLPSTYLGESITADMIVLRYTLKGDANLDRVVNFDDLLKLAAAYNQTGSWSGGDFTGDGLVNFDDLLMLAANYNANLSADWAMAMTLVPEPAVLVLSLSAFAVLQRKRR